MKAFWFLVGFVLTLSIAAQASASTVAVCGSFTITQLDDGRLAVNGNEVIVEAISTKDPGVTLKSDDGSVDVKLIPTDVGTTMQTFWLVEDEDTTHHCRELKPAVMDKLASLRKK